jgi:hypothetical protein
LPSRPVINILPPPGYVGPLLKHVTVTNDEERASVRQVLEVSEGHVVASQVFLLAEDDLIRIEPSLKVFELLVNSGLVCLTTTQLLEQLLVRERGNVRVKIGDLDRGRLFEQGLLLEIGRDEASSTLVRIFFDQIASDSARLIDDEAVVIDVRNLAEWLDLEVLWGLVCALGKINGDELVGDLLLFADQGNETGASGLGVTVEFDDHDYSGAWTR